MRKSRRTASSFDSGIGASPFANCGSQSTSGVIGACARTHVYAHVPRVCARVYSRASLSAVADEGLSPRAHASTMSLISDSAPDTCLSTMPTRQGGNREQELPY